MWLKVRARAIFHGIMSPSTVPRMRFFAVGLDHPEGLAFDTDGNLWCGYHITRIVLPQGGGQ